MVNENINIINSLIMYYYSTDYGDVIYIDNSKLSLNINDNTFYQFIYINGNSDNIYFIIINSCNYYRVVFLKL